jgi:hypothetical protein
MREGWLDGDDVDWDGRLAEAEQAQDAGKHVWLPANGARDDEDERLFALASFLLADRGRAVFRYTSYDTYDQLWLDGPEYRHDLGAPRGDRREEDGVWVREFENGTVSVDPARRRGAISLDRRPARARPAGSRTRARRLR